MKADLLEIALLNIPPPEPQHNGFLEITQQQSSEVIISRTYHYFLSQNNNPKIAKLFLDSLLALIEENEKGVLEIEDFYSAIEVHTKEGKFIDLLIESTDGENAIIIENKIYHVVNNDLQEYYNHSKAKNKVGVLLTLTPTPIPKNVAKLYCNITHSQWLKKLTEMGLPINLNTNEYVYLNDFINTINQLATSMEMNEQAEFFFNNTDKILRAQQTYNEAFNFIINQITIAGIELDLPMYGNAKPHRHLWERERKSNVYYTIVFDKLLKPERELLIILELYKDAIQYDEALRQYLKDDEIYKNLYKEARRDRYYIQFATQTYTLNSDDINTLGKFITEKINNEFAPVKEKVESYINQL